MNRIFFISQVFYPDEVSTAGLFTGLCACLAEDGSEVEVWSAQPSYTHSGRQPRVAYHRGIKVRYLPSTRFHKSKFLGRLLNIMTFQVSVTFRLVFTRDRTPVFTHTTPPSLGIIVSWICALKRRKLVYIMLDIFPEGLIRLGRLKRNSLFVKFWKKMFRGALKRSTRILVLGRDMYEYITGIYTGGAQKTLYIPHWQDEELVSPVALEGHPFIEEYKLGGRFIVQYSGNMGLWNDMVTLGRAVNRNMENVKFVFIGGGMRLADLQQSILPASLENALFLPFQPSEKMGLSLTACHVSLVSLRDGLHGMAVPSKIYGILAAGTPVIALVPEDSEISLVVKEEECGYVVQPGDTDGLVKAILQLKSDENLRVSMGQNARIAFEQKYTTVIIAGRYRQLIQELDS